MTSPRYRSVVLDVDSTLCGVEGVDWLAARRGAEIAERTRALTERAMNGEIALESVYGDRLSLIRPTKSDIDALAREYSETIAPGAREAIARMLGAGVRVVLVSGGIRQAIAPLASELGVELHAVDVDFSPDGAYAGIVPSPLTTQLGKLDVVRGLGLARPALAVGDGATDAAMKPAVDRFVAYTGIVRRESVVQPADDEIRSFGDLVGIVLERA